MAVNESPPKSKNVSLMLISCTFISSFSSSTSSLSVLFLGITTSWCLFFTLGIGSNFLFTFPLGVYGNSLISIKYCGTMYFGKLADIRVRKEFTSISELDV